jgi:hypothetical protein
LQRNTDLTNNATADAVAFQSVKKAPNRQNAKHDGLGVCVFKDSLGKWKFRILSHKELATQGVLTSCANRMTNVPVYAFAFGLLGFGTFLTSASLSKNSFSTN